MRETSRLWNSLLASAVLESDWRELQNTSKQFGATNGNLPQNAKTRALFIAVILVLMVILTRILLLSRQKKFPTVTCFVEVSPVKTILWLLRCNALGELKVRKVCFGGRFIVS